MTSCSARRPIATGFSVAVDEAAERERAKIATELHDDTIQVMTAATMKLDDCASRAAAGGRHAMISGRRSS